MGQFLAMLIIPAVVGVVPYIAFRLIWEKNEDASATINRRDPFTDGDHARYLQGDWGAT
jgi:hypothetical protein